MPFVVAGRDVERIAIVDDDRAVRESYEESIREVGAEPIQESGPLEALATFAQRTRDRTQAALCDFKLRVKNYAAFDGAELTAHWYRLGFPALLCTKWDKASIDEVRRYRPCIPVLIKPSELDPDRITAGLEVCIHEFAGKRVPSRRVWRTMVRVEEVSDGTYKYVYVVVPGWEPKEVIGLPFADIPDAVQALVKPDARLYAKVNLGAESYEDLFFDEWEPS